MKKPYQLILDFWEVNADVEPDILMENGVSGLIVRLNDMRGGHHMDERFDDNWALALKFDIQALYFVYNPWVSGVANFIWLMSHLPLNYGNRRILVDIEVRYPDYSPITYARETAKFCELVSASHIYARYSGGGYLDILNPWPKNEEYWWAAYSDRLTKCSSWEEYKHILSYLSYEAFTKLSPGPARMWQATGDGLRLPGFGNHAVDVNVFPGTLEEAQKWFGCSVNIDHEEEIPSMKQPMGLLTSRPGWSTINPNYDFVVGMAQRPGSVDPNPEIKSIEIEARTGKIPMLLGWNHLPWTYSEQQWGEANWPDLNHDYIWKNFRGILEQRDYAGVVVFAQTYKTKDGKDEEDEAFVAYSVKTFMERVQVWLKEYRPNVPLILGSSNEFISKHAQNINVWAHNFESMAVQQAQLGKDSYPIAGSKPMYLGRSIECPWWRYHEKSDSALVMFRGQNGYPATVDGMRRWLNLDPIDDGDAEPPTNIDELLNKLDLAARTFQSDLEKLRAITRPK